MTYIAPGDLNEKSLTDDFTLTTTHLSHTFLFVCQKPALMETNSTNLDLMFFLLGI